MRRVDPFKIADELIGQKYRVPSLPKLDAIPNGSFMTTDSAGVIDLGELLYFIQKAYLRLAVKVEDYERVLSAYAEKKPSTEYWSSGYPNTYDPQSGFTGAVSGSFERDDYKEAREVFLKHNPKEPK